MYSLTNRSSNTLPFLHMPNAEYARLVGIPLPPPLRTNLDTPPRTPTSSTRTCSFAGPLSSHPVSPIDFSFPPTPSDGASYRQSSPLSMHVLERRLERAPSRLSERGPPVPTKDRATAQRFNSNSGLGLSTIPSPTTRADEFFARNVANISVRHTMIEPAFDDLTPKPLVIHSYITPPSSQSPPTRPSLASRFFGRSFRNSGINNSGNSSKRRSRDLSPVLSQHSGFPDTPQTSTSTSPRSLSAVFPVPPTTTAAAATTYILPQPQRKSKPKTTSRGFTISAPMPLVESPTEISNRDSFCSTVPTARPVMQQKSNGQAVPRLLQRKKSVGNWFEAAKRKSGLWWDGSSNVEEEDKENQAPVNARKSIALLRGEENAARLSVSCVEDVRGGGIRMVPASVYGGDGCSAPPSPAEEDEERRFSVVPLVAPKLPEFQQMGIRINGGKVTGLVKVLGDIGR